MDNTNTSINSALNNILKKESPNPVPPPVKTTDYQRQDRIVRNSLKALGVGIILVLITLLVLLFSKSIPVIMEVGSSFITSSWWNPIDDEFGALSFAYGTLLTSFVALLLAAPVSIGVAVFITEVLPEKLSKVLGLFVEMIAAVPSIVFGLWGIFSLAPWIKEDLTPILKSSLGFLPFFQGPSFGLGQLTASLILAIMIVPTITSICREVFKTVPQYQKEAALALGATRFEMIKLSILKPSFSGMMGGIVLGLGRALGETMAVAMVIGNSASINLSLFAPGATMASVIANEYAEAESDLHLSALCMVAVLLFAVTLGVNIFARYIVWKSKKVK
ncbi:MAG: phosphate ABC transporter permease subunit PstC [Bacteriovoracaceae bacterium]